MKGENKMKQSVTITDFIDAFEKMRPSNFTYEGLESLYNYTTLLNPHMKNYRDEVFQMRLQSQLY